MTIPTAPVYDLIPGETPGQRIARILCGYDGCSAKVNRAKLAAFVCRGIEDESFVDVSTNCAVVGLAILYAAGVQHKLLQTKYVNGMAFAWMVQIGNDLGAWEIPSANNYPTVGSGLWYEIAGQNDDHYETLVGLNPTRHAGGGRPGNFVTAGPGQIDYSWGRPLRRWLNPDKLGLTVIAANVTDVEPHPEIDGAHV